MSLDFNRLVEQVQTFITNEKDTVSGLIFFWIVGLLGIHSLFTNIFTEQKEYFIPVLLAFFVLTLLLWIGTRRVKVDRKRATVAVANFTVLSLDPKHAIAGQDKLNLEREIVEYVGESLHGHKNRLELGQFVEVIRLPRRIAITERSAQRIARRLGVDVLIWGTVRYSGESTVVIEPHFDFRAEPTNSFYGTFREKLLSRSGYKVDLNAEMKGEGESLLSQLIHYTLYLGVMFYGIKRMEQHRHDEADKVFRSVRENLRQIKTPNHALYDIYLLSTFYAGRNLHLWGKRLAGRGREEGLAKYNEASEIFFSSAHGKARTKGEEEFLEDFYLYGVHLLIREGKYEKAQERLVEIEREAKKNPLFLKEQIELLTKKNASKAKKIIARLKGKKLPDKVYQEIGDFLYERREYPEAAEYYEKKLLLNEHQLFNPALLDVEDHLHLMRVHLQHLRLIRANEEALQAALNEIRNRLRPSL